MIGVAIVVLAAGAGSRFGGVKQLARIGDESFVARAVRVAVEAAADDAAEEATQVLVVTGAHADLVAAEIRETAVRVLFNAAWESGQASSVRTAIAAIEESGDDVGAALFLPVDQPLLDAPLLRVLIGAWRAGAAIAAPRGWRRRAAHRRSSTGAFMRNYAS